MPASVGKGERGVVRGNPLALRRGSRSKVTRNDYRQLGWLLKSLTVSQAQGLLVSEGLLSLRLPGSILRTVIWQRNSNARTAKVGFRMPKTDRPDVEKPLGNP